MKRLLAPLALVLAMPACGDDCQDGPKRTEADWARLSTAEHMRLVSVEAAGGSLSLADCAGCSAVCDRVGGDCTILSCTTVPPQTGGPSTTPVDSVYCEVETIDRCSS